METLAKKSLVATSGVTLSLITFYFMCGWYDIFPWALAALIIGYTSKDRRSAIINGGIFGYFLFIAYIFAGYKGKTDAGSMVKFIAVDVLFSLVGSIACAIGAIVGNWIKGKFVK